MSIGDILLLSLLGLAIAAAVRAVRRGKGCGCGGDCAHCGGCRRKNS